MAHPICDSQMETSKTITSIRLFDRSQYLWTWFVYPSLWNNSHQSKREGGKELQAAYKCQYWSQWGGKNVPIIGDNVYIGPGAILFGDIRIGDNVMIGANSTVTKSFEESNIVIAGSPAKIIKRL